MQSDPSVNLRAYRAYDWVENSSTTRHDVGSLRVEWRAFDRQVKTAVEQALADKGYVRQRGGAADFLVDYRLVVRERQTESFQDYYWYRRTGGSASPQEAFAIGYDEATLTLEFTDPRAQRPVWRASASAVFDPVKENERLREAVRLMIDKLP